jgi:hypothetical protein
MASSMVFTAILFTGGVSANGLARPRLHVAAVTADTGDGQAGFDGAQYAVDLINNNSDILPDYELVAHRVSITVCCMFYIHVFNSYTNSLCIQIDSQIILLDALLKW